MFENMKQFYHTLQKFSFCNISYDCYTRTNVLVVNILILWKSLLNISSAFMQIWLNATQQMETRLRPSLGMEDSLSEEMRYTGTLNSHLL